MTLQNVGEDALVHQLGIVYQILQVQGDFGGVEVAQLPVLLILLHVVLLEQGGRLLRRPIARVEVRQIAVVVDYHRLLFVVVHHGIRLRMLLIVVHLRRIHRFASIKYFRPN